MQELRDHLRKEILIGSLSNVFFNGVIAWLLLRSVDAMTWRGEHSFAIDLIATGFLLPLIVALIVMSIHRRKVRTGSMQTMSFGASSGLQAIAGRLPASTWGSAIIFGLVGMGVLAPATLACFYLLGIETIPPVWYAVFKGIWAGAVVALLLPPMILVALRGAEVTPDGCSGR